MKNIFITLIFVTVFALKLNGQTAHFASDGTLVVTDGSHSFRIADISESIDHVPTAPCVHAVQKRNGQYFIVVTTSNFTRGHPPRGGAGGCGEEAYIQWLHIVKDKVSETTEFRFQSWSDNREGGIDGWQNSIFSVTTEDELEDRVQAKDHYLFI